MKIYTKTGDNGDTSMQGGTRISKSNPRITAYGAVDETNAILGIVLAENPDPDVVATLRRIQSDLFVLGSDLSNPNLNDLRNRVTPAMIVALESTIDKFDDELPALSNFILPGGDVRASHLHHARTVARRAESMTVLLSETDEINVQCAIYLNRLSDLLYVLARLLNRRVGCDDVTWSARDNAAGNKN